MVRSTSFLFHYDLAHVIESQKVGYLYVLRSVRVQSKVQSLACRCAVTALTGAVDHYKYLLRPAPGKFAKPRLRTVVAPIPCDMHEYILVGHLSPPSIYAINMHDN
jgi:hypothetical protein